VQSAGELVDYDDIAQIHWETPDELKNKVLRDCGRGEDLLLTRLAQKIAKRRPIKDRKKV
jgi:hypothetical protein